MKARGEATTSSGDSVQVAPIGEPCRDLRDLPLPHAVDKDVGAGVEEDGSPDLVGPEVVVAEPPQAGLDPPEHYRGPRHRPSGRIGVRDHSPVRPGPRPASRRVGVVRTDPVERGVVVHHRIHRPGSDADEQAGDTQGEEALRPRPVRLGEDTHAVAEGFQEPAYDGGPERGVVDVGVTRDDHGVAGVPAQI